MRKEQDKRWRIYIYGSNTRQGTNFSKKQEKDFSIQLAICNFLSDSSVSAAGVKSNTVLKRERSAA